jgi:hypothetical protein
MKAFRLIAVPAALLTLGAATVAQGAPTDTGALARATALREFEGKVVAVNRAAHRFRLRDAERGVVRIKVTRATRFERLDGLADLHVGMRRIEATVRRSNGTWVATEVERSGGGGHHGGADDNGGNDDDPSGDDH